MDEIINVIKFYETINPLFFVLQNLCRLVFVYYNNFGIWRFPLFSNIAFQAITHITIVALARIVPK